MIDTSSCHCFFSHTFPPHMTTYTAVLPTQQQLWHWLILCSLQMQSADWVVFNTSQQLELMRVTCGGWHRPFTYSCQSLASLLFIHHQPRDHSTHVHQRMSQHLQTSTDRQPGQLCYVCFAPCLHLVHHRPRDHSTHVHRHMSQHAQTHTDRQESRSIAQCTFFVLAVFFVASPITLTCPAQDLSHTQACTDRQQDQAYMYMSGSCRVCKGFGCCHFAKPHYALLTCHID